MKTMFRKGERANHPGHIPQDKRRAVGDFMASHAGDTARETCQSTRVLAEISRQVIKAGCPICQCDDKLVHCGHDGAASYLQALLIH